MAYLSRYDNNVVKVVKGIYEQHKGEEQSGP